MTHVDRCESEPAAAEAANADGAGRAGAALRRQSGVAAGARLDRLRLRRHAARGPTPRRIRRHRAACTAAPSSKASGAVLAALPGALVVRTSWVFGPGTQLRAHDPRSARARAQARTKRPLRVVDDQRGSPTYAGDLADGISALVEAGASGVYHLANRGVATWWESGARRGRHLGLSASCRSRSVAHGELPRPAPRPAWSVLDTRKAERARRAPAQLARGAARVISIPMHSPLRELGGIVVSGTKAEADPGHGRRRLHRLASLRAPARRRAAK